MKKKGNKEKNPQLLSEPKGQKGIQRDAEFLASSGITKKRRVHGNAETKKRLSPFFSLCPSYAELGAFHVASLLCSTSAASGGQGSPLTLR